MSDRRGDEEEDGAAAVFPWKTRIERSPANGHLESDRRLVSPSLRLSVSLSLSLSLFAIQSFHGESGANNMGRRQNLTKSARRVDIAEERSGTLAKREDGRAVAAPA